MTNAYTDVSFFPRTAKPLTSYRPYWAKRLKKSALHALQVSQRGGELFVTLKGSRVIISGQAVPYLEGQIHVPAARSSWQQAAK